MSPDRRIYITTGVLAVVLATAINVLKPRDPLAGIATPLEPSATARTAQTTSTQTMEVSARTTERPQRAGPSL